MRGDKHSGLEVTHNGQLGCHEYGVSAARRLGLGAVAENHGTLFNWWFQEV